MTLFAGIFSRKNLSIPEETCDSLRQLISRNALDAVSVFKDERSFFVKVDINAFGEPGFHRGPVGALSLLAGEPLLAFHNDAAWRSREPDLQLIHELGSGGEWDILRRAEGTFCAVHYQPLAGKLNLIADKLGIRPLYYWIDENAVVFATALRVLEGLMIVPKRMDVRAVTEIIGLGAALSDRTPYAGISLLKAAEIVEVTETEVSRRRYWRWDEIEHARASEQECLSEVYKRFQNATARRIRDNKTTGAYLSGGLDSRCVVAALVEARVQVHTFNFARPGTQDQLFGDDFASRMETIHANVPKEPGDRVPDYSHMMARAWNDSQHRMERPAERPALIWSGEGGSVLLGHVHMNESIIEKMRAGRVDAAIEEYFQRESVHVPPKLFKPEVFAKLSDVILEGIREELAELESEDAGRNFYLFLMHNDQRRKLARHFENIDLHRLEFQLPFFDSAFLASVIATPLDLCLRHRFYVKWLSLFPPEVTKVPWQAYPGHEPCPLPVSEELSYQWDEKYQARERAAQKRALLKQASELLSASDFPADLLSKRNLRLATWAHSTGWRDYEYIIAAARTFHSYWKKCDGQFALPLSGAKSV